MKQRVFFILLYLSFLIPVAAQEIPPERVYNETEVDEKPQYGDKPEAIYKFLGSTVRYPMAASRNEVSGTVIVSFIISKEGKMDSVVVKDGPGFGLNEEASRAIKASSGKWHPALIRAC